MPYRDRSLQNSWHGRRSRAVQATPAGTEQYSLPTTRLEVGYRACLGGRGIGCIAKRENVVIFFVLQGVFVHR